VAASNGGGVEGQQFSEYLFVRKVFPVWPLRWLYSSCATIVTDGRSIPSSSLCHIIIIACFDYRCAESVSTCCRPWCTGETNTANRPVKLAKTNFIIWPCEPGRIVRGSVIMLFKYL
jgi:hypothetical protein